MDIIQKRAQYIEKNNGINQEFYFVHPLAKIKLNNIYNCHFSGSPISNIFSPGAKQFEGTYNRSIKIMCGLPLETHRYLIEPITGGPGFRIQLIKRFISFTNKIKKCRALKLVADRRNMDRAQTKRLIGLLAHARAKNSICVHIYDI